MNERKHFLQFKYIAKTIIYLLFAIIIWNISKSFSTFRFIYIILMVIILAVTIFYDYLKYNIELIMGMVAEANNHLDTIVLIKKVENLDKINGVKNSLILPKALLFLDSNNPEGALEFVEKNENFMRSQLDYLLILKYTIFKSYTMLEDQDKAITAYQDLLKLKEENMKNKRMKLLFNWQQIEALYELQIKNYKRCKNLYNACDISKYNQRELLQYYFEIKCLAIKTNDRPLFNKCHDEMDKINSSSPLNIEWR